MGLLAESSVDAVYTIFFVTLQECLSAHYGAEISLKICPPKKCRTVNIVHYIVM